MKRALLGYYIRRTWKQPVPAGKTICAWAQTLYPSRSAAAHAMLFATKLDPAFEYDVAPVFMRIPETDDGIALVREFHETYEQPIADAPNVNDFELNVLRVKLLAEEVSELADALGVYMRYTIDTEMQLPTAPDPVAALDACTDIQYVLDGAYLQLGLHKYKAAALAEVHRSNMSKLGEDGKPIKRADGKILKGPNYSPPDLASVLKSE